MDLLTSIGYALVAGFVAGAAVSYGLRFAIGRRCFRLEVALADLQRVVASLKGVEYSATRWKKRDQELAELGALKNTRPAQRFDNDFPTARED